VAAGSGRSRWPFDEMKRIKRIAFWSGLGVFGYFVIYFSSVQASLYKSAGPVAPSPMYGWPSDSDFTHAVFAPAQFIDATLLRRGYWAPSHTSPNYPAGGNAELGAQFADEYHCRGVPQPGC
jgi:hypothetical protein